MHKGHYLSTHSPLTHALCHWVVGNVPRSRVVLVTKQRSLDPRVGHSTSKKEKCANSEQSTKFKG